MNNLASQVIVEIINRQMNMPANSVWVRDQNRKIPNDDNLYIIVGMVDSRVISNNSEMIERDVEGTPTQFEVTSAQTLENIQIDLFSRSNDAILRKVEVITSLGSIYSKQKQEENNFKIFRLSKTFVNSSIAEGGSQLNRYTLAFSCAVWYKEERELTPDGEEYYDDFDTRVDDKTTIGEDNGLIEFTIDENTEI